MRITKAPYGTEPNRNYIDVKFRYGDAWPSRVEPIAIPTRWY